MKALNAARCQQLVAMERIRAVIKAVQLCEDALENMFDGEQFHLEDDALGECAMTDEEISADRDLAQSCALRLHAFQYKLNDYESSECFDRLSEGSLGPDQNIPTIFSEEVATA